MIELFFRAIFGTHNVEDGTTCEISKRLWDVHDCHKHKGGTGVPQHFFTYVCRECGARW